MSSRKDKGEESAMYSGFDGGGGGNFNFNDALARINSALIRSAIGEESSEDLWLEPHLSADNRRY